MGVFSLFCFIMVSCLQICALVLVTVSCANACSDAWDDWCPENIAVDPTICYQGNYEKDCCKSCAKYNTGVKGCEYGDKVSWCGEYTSADCSDDYIAKYCCTICGGGSGGGRQTTRPPVRTTRRPVYTTRRPTTNGGGDDGDDDC